MLGERPLVLDREFSYLELLLNLVEEQLNFVIRLNLVSNPPKFFDGEGQEVALTISPGETVIHNGVWYKGQACVNLIGTWKKGFSMPLCLTKIASRVHLIGRKAKNGDVIPACSSCSSKGSPSLLLIAALSWTMPLLLSLPSFTFLSQLMSDLQKTRPCKPNAL